MPKGKYYGPDKFKGKVPKGYKGDAKGKFFGPEKKKGLAPTKTKAKAKTTTKKPNSLQRQANELTNAQYAGVLGQLEDTKESNLNQYGRYIGERTQALKSEIGSNNQTGTIVQNAIAGRKGNLIANAKQAYEKQELSRGVRDSAVEAENTNALSNYEALMRARGIEPTQAAGMAENFKTQQGFTAALDDINRKSATDTEQAAGTAMDTLATQAQMGNFNAQANARANAQKDFNSQYASTLTENERLSGELAKTKLDKGSANLNTYLTLKKEREQAIAEQAQSRLEAAVAMGKQSSDDYFKEAKLNLDTIKVKNTQKNSDRDFTLKQQNALNDWKVDADKGVLDKAKFQAYLKKEGITLANLPPTLRPYATNIRITSPSDPRSR